jgi:hypothetical protein
MTEEHARTRRYAKSHVRDLASSSEAAHPRWPRRRHPGHRQ